MDRTCAVCQKDYTKYTYMETACGHRYHSYCWDNIDSDKNYQKKCPLCRQLTTVKYYPFHMHRKYEEHIDAFAFRIYYEYEKHTKLTNCECDNDCQDYGELDYDDIVKNARLIVKCAEKIEKYTPIRHKNKELTISDDEFAVA